MTQFQTVEQLQATTIVSQAAQIKRLREVVIEVLENVTMTQETE